jgi:hypothetical protein
MTYCDERMIISRYVVSTLNSILYVVCPISYSLPLRRYIEELDIVPWDAVL